MEYRQFLETLEPSILGLDSATCSLDRERYWSASKDARRVLSSKYALTEVTDDYFDVQATFSVALQWSEGDGPLVQPLKIECVFMGHFHTPPPLNREFAKRFAETESWLVFWPFFRQFVSDATARMAIPPVVVPLALGPGEHSYRRSPKPTVEAPAHKPHRRIVARKKR